MADVNFKFLNGKHYCVIILIRIQRVNSYQNYLPGIDLNVTFIDLCVSLYLSLSLSLSPIFLCWIVVVTSPQFTKMFYPKPWLTSVGFFETKLVESIALKVSVIPFETETIGCSHRFDCNLTTLFSLDGSS